MVNLLCTADWSTIPAAFIWQARGQTAGILPIGMDPFLPVLNNRFRSESFAVRPSGFISMSCPAETACSALSDPFLPFFLFRSSLQLTDLRGGRGTTGPCIRNLCKITQNSYWIFNSYAYANCVTCKINAVLLNIA